MLVPRSSQRPCAPTIRATHTPRVQIHRYTGISVHLNGRNYGFGTIRTICQAESKEFPQESAEDIKEISELSEAPVQYSKEFVRTRLITFAGIVLGYASFYLTRNSLTYTAPAMVADASLGVSMTDIGALTSLFPIMYGMSKFFSGVLGSKTSPRILLAGGLMATAAMNIAFGFSASMLWFSVFWSMNGMLQGLGAPGCARILTSWFAAKERGTYWGMWNIAHNLGGFIAPILAGTAAKMYGWQWGLFAPGLIGITMGILVLLGVKDSPESAGFSPVERSDSNSNTSSTTKNEGKKESLLDLLGVTSWFVFYLLQVKEVADAGAASLRVSGLELGGLFGSLIAGKVSDILISRSKGKEGTVGKRIQVVIVYTIGIAAMLAAFAQLLLPWVPSMAHVFMIGFFLYGPQMMIGLCGAELVRPDSVGASQGFLGWVAYIGAANAGIPLSMVVQNMGWGAYFSTLMAACGIAVLLLLPMTNAKSYSQNIRLCNHIKQSI
eukprot:jgi/Picre1/32323/NNA_007669.t1